MAAIAAGAGNPMAGESVNLDLTGTRSPGIVSDDQLKQVYAQADAQALRAWLPAVAVVAGAVALIWLVNRGNR